MFLVCLKCLCIDFYFMSSFGHFQFCHIFDLICILILKKIYNHLVIPQSVNTLFYLSFKCVFEKEQKYPRLIVNLFHIYIYYYYYITKNTPKDALGVVMREPLWDCEQLCMLELGFHALGVLSAPRNVERTHSTARPHHQHFVVGSYTGGFNMVSGQGLSSYTKAEKWFAMTMLLTVTSCVCLGGKSIISYILHSHQDMLPVGYGLEVTLV